MLGVRSATVGHSARFRRGALRANPMNFTLWKIGFFFNERNIRCDNSNFTFYPTRVWGFEYAAPKAQFENADTKKEMSLLISSELRFRLIVRFSWIDVILGKNVGFDQLENRFILRLFPVKREFYINKAGIGIARLDPFVNRPSRRVSPPSFA